MLTEIFTSIMLVKLTIVLLLAFFITGQTAFSSVAKHKIQAQTIQYLSDWHWQYRVLIVNAENAETIATLRSALILNQQNINERKLKILLLIEEKVVLLTPSNTLKETGFNIAKMRDRLQTKPSILIGLDGGTKSFYDWPTSDFAVDLQQVFADIDGMPMRRSEI